MCVNQRPDGAPKGSCAARGSVALHHRLKDLVKELGLAERDVRVMTSSCLDACLAGPVVAVEPDHYLCGRVRLEDVPALVDCVARGERPEGLVLGPDEA